MTTVALGIEGCAPPLGVDPRVTPLAIAVAGDVGAGAVDAAGRQLAGIADRPAGHATVRCCSTTVEGRTDKPADAPLDMGHVNGRVTEIAGLVVASGTGGMLHVAPQGTGAGVGGAMAGTAAGLTDVIPLRIRVGPPFQGQLAVGHGSATMTVDIAAPVGSGIRGHHRGNGGVGGSRLELVARGRRVR